MPHTHPRAPGGQRRKIPSWSTGLASCGRERMRTSPQWERPSLGLLLRSEQPKTLNEPRTCAQPQSSLRYRRQDAACLQGSLQHGCSRQGSSRESSRGEAGGWHPGPGAGCPALPLLLCLLWHRPSPAPRRPGPTFRPLSRPPTGTVTHRPMVAPRGHCPPSLHVRASFFCRHAPSWALGP